MGFHSLLGFWAGGAGLVGYVSTFTLTDLSVSSDVSINLLKVNVFSRETVSSDTRMFLRLRSNGEDIDVPMYGPVTTYELRTFIFSISPFTDKKWTISEVNALEVGVGVGRSLASPNVARCTSILVQVELDMDTFSLPHTTNTLVYRQQELGHFTNCLVRRPDRDVTHTSNVLSKKALNAQHTTNLLARADRTRTHQTNTKIWAQKERSHQTNTLVRGDRFTFHTSNLLALKKRDSFHTTDCWAERAGQRSHTTNTYIAYAPPPLDALICLPFFRRKYDEGMDLRVFMVEPFKRKFDVDRSLRVFAVPAVQRAFVLEQERNINACGD